jgi:hypothetical protein
MKFSMVSLAKAYVYLIAVAFLMLGELSYIAPTGEMFVMKFGVIPDPSSPAHGLNSMRGMFGGVLFSFGVMIILAYKTLNRVWLDAVTLSMGLLVLGRVIAFFVDGFDALSIGGFIGELVTIPVLLYAGKGLAEDSKK